ncbi:MAG: hypothetical protein KR126chlam1_00557 [Chlamydiae bacterium]|nr:hypothetical protein [Chlamydiota bacterium]
MSNTPKELYHALVSDTLALIKEKIPVIKTKEIPKLSLPLPKIEPVKAPVAREEPPPPLIEKPSLPPKPSTEKNEPIFAMVKKHLPHIKLIEEIPLPPIQQGIAILLFHPEDLPFIKKLANAIQTHLCPVQIFDGEKLEKENSWEKLQSDERISLLLTQREELPAPLSSLPKIFLAQATTYQNNPQEKKMLWKALCQQVPQQSHSSS